MESSILVKAFALLEVLADAGGALPLGEASLRAHLSKPTCRRVLQSLIALGYVSQDADGKYRLTGKLRQIGLGPADRWLVAAAEPALRRLHANLGETVNLGVLRQGRVLYLGVMESVHPLRRVAAVQESDPFFSTALGRAIVSFEGPAVREFLLRHTPLEKQTPATVVDPKTLERVFAETKRRGYAIEKDQTDLGVTCIAAPILTSGRAIAAISISVPTARFNEHGQERFATAATKTAAAIAREVAKHERALA
jgi:DNA-binding IclR family transcriptional regulator